MKKWMVFGAVLALALVIAACGANSGSNNSGAVTVDASVSPTSEVLIKASNYEFDQQEYQIKAGEPTAIKLTSVGGVHGVQILKSKIKIDNNESITVQFDKPGTYDMICYVPCGNGHGKMRAKIVVT
ncbi:cupredoxin domain-containing protein [Paenibacillus sp. strain BS8-2]